MSRDIIWMNKLYGKYMRLNDQQRNELNEIIIDEDYIESSEPNESITRSNQNIMDTQPINTPNKYNLRSTNTDKKK